mmetsp:Transcript_4748/g.6259  ORF Transcript_4748/g.6259 Transcript_4748/m.6259 type:complete len:209 (+) Transcript_4748:548-1174(+)
MRTGFIALAFAVSIADLVYSVITPYYPYIANLMRVVVVLCFSSGLRISILSLFQDVRDSIAILITIFTYILFFTIVVYYFYEPTFLGISDFKNIRRAYRNMAILFTTANYPDIMLPEFRHNFYNIFLFALFLIAGPYFLMNLLMANVFNKYTQRLEAARSERQNKRARHIEVIFNKHDHDQSGYLEEMEAKAFLADVLDFDYTNEVHR